MKEIFDMQHKLNKTVLDKLGIDYGLILSAPERHGHWIENYRKALSAEYAELLRDVIATPEDEPISSNAKVEIIDMLHFLVSVSQIVGIAPDEAMSQDSLDSDLPNFTEVVFLALDDLQNSVKWKWWALGGGFKPELASTATEQLWRCWHYLASVLGGLSFQEAKGLYMAKNKVNFERQESGYSEDTKTEDDNQALCSQ